MKNYLLIIILLIMTIFLNAEFIEMVKAEICAENWLKYISAKEVHISEQMTFAGKEEIALYGFSFSPEGFVIISSETNVIPILAYSSLGAVKKDNIPPSTMQMLQNYIDQIDLIREKKLSNQKNQNIWENIQNNDFSSFPKNDRDVSPLLSSTWGQGNPYNMYCPTIGGQHTLVGCVAVAIGQIMRYHGHPEHGTGSNSYSWNGQTVSADFENTTYNWSNMPNYLSYGSSYSQKQAVATLLFHCGVGTNMDYGLDGSGTNSYTAEYALKYYFGYSHSLELVLKEDHQIVDFQNILKEDLNNGLPIYYAGTDQTVGHAFVCDGYQGENFFHFNWGWESWFDGYFYLNNLTPGSYNFNYDQEAIVHIRKPVVPFPPTNLNALVLGFDVLLTWEIPEETDQLIGYNIYRDDELVYFNSGVELISYYDFGLSVGEHNYFVTSLYDESEFIQLESDPSNTVNVQIGTNAENDILAITSSKLCGNYPNPFNPETTIFFELTAKDAKNAKIEIYNIKGQKIKKFKIQNLKFKINEVVWDGKDEEGKVVPTGIYLYRLAAGEKSITKRMLLLK